MRFYPARCIRSLLCCAAFLTLTALIFYSQAPSPTSSDHQQKDHNKDHQPKDHNNDHLRGVEPVLKEKKKAPASSSAYGKISWEPEEEIETPPDKPGEGGKPVILSGEEAKKAAEYAKQNGFNIYISDLIAYNRSIPDIRHKECKNKVYRKDLPKASIIIPFFNEHFSSLMRTVDSSILRGHPKLIQEFILVDDGSDRPFLGKQLDDYIEEHYAKDFVRVVRLKPRAGLIRARIAGAEAATGSVLIFLDSHCEPSKNWLPPLLDLIAQDYRAVPCPLIDIIESNTFAYFTQDEGARGAFDWELSYKRLPMVPESLKHPEEPFPMPVMAGGLFAISAKWFKELGYYDPELEIWGGEQYELSFKLWMCGGAMYEVPCSRVGHIYRGGPTNFPAVAHLGNFVGRNYKRVAEVWMDDYKEYVYKRHPEYRPIDAGDLSQRFAIRERLACKSFEWFLKEVAFDVIKNYPLIDPVPGATGELRPVAMSDHCIDSNGANGTEPLRLQPCSRGDTQQFQFTFRRELRQLRGKDCFDRAGALKAPITLFVCHSGFGNQHWGVAPVNKADTNPVQIRHPPSDSCLAFDSESKAIITDTCQSQNKQQQWTWTNLQLATAVLMEV